MPNDAVFVIQQTGHVTIGCVQQPLRRNLNATITRERIADNVASR